MTPEEKTLRHLTDTLLEMQEAGKIQFLLIATHNADNKLKITSAAAISNDQLFNSLCSIGKRGSEEIKQAIINAALRLKLDDMGVTDSCKKGGDQ